MTADTGRGHGPVMLLGQILDQRGTLPQTWLGHTSCPAPCYTSMFAQSWRAQWLVVLPSVLVHGRRWAVGCVFMWAGADVLCVPLGHGECHCGECKCHAGYIGDNCNCSTDISTCLAKDGQICSDRGHCVCGQCQCTEPGAFGETCEKCPTCPDACSTKR